MQKFPPKDWLKAARERCEAATPEPWSIATVHRLVAASRGGDLRFIEHARTDIPRALTALQAADALVAVVQRLEQSEASVRLAGLGGHEVETMLAEARSARAAVRLARATYIAARHGEPQEQG